jgi:hypothetical protein
MDDKHQVVAHCLLVLSWLHFSLAFGFALVDHIWKPLALVDEDDQSKWTNRMRPNLNPRRKYFNFNKLC